MNATEVMPINFLDIQPLRHNVIPCELDGITDYSILHDATEYGSIGNEADLSPSDLSKKDGFILWRKQGAWSFPHIDEHGTYIGVLCEEGEKLWFSWTLADPGLQEWAETRQRGERYDPQSSDFSILLRRGDLLFQPPGTVHAPLSLTSMAMQGFLLWSSRTMVKTARSALLDLGYSEVTNHLPRKELKNKLQHLARASKAQLPPYT
jgi:hypothetical protein